MKQTIECGLLSNIGNSLKSMSKGLFKSFDKLMDMGAKLADYKEDGDGFTTTIETPDGNIVKAKCTPAEKEDTFNLELKGTGGKHLSKQDVDSTDIVKLMNDTAKEWFGDPIDDSKEDDDSEDSNEPVEENTKLRIALKRIVGSTEDEISLVAIDKNSKICQPMTYDELDDMIVTTVSDDDVVSEIGEDAVTVEISPTSEGLSIEFSQRNDWIASNSCYNLLYEAFKLRAIVENMLWNVCGDGYEYIQCKLERMKYELDNELSEFAKQVYYLDDGVAYPMLTMNMDSCICHKVDAKDALDKLQTPISAYISLLNLYNYDGTYQSDRIKNIIYYWESDLHDIVRANPC